MVFCAVIRQRLVWAGGSLGKLHGCLTSVLVSRNACCKDVYVKDPNIPPPWPYKQRGYKSWYSFIDRTTKRFDENTKLFVVEGNIGSGKSKVARELADKFGFHFLPAPSLDDIFVDSYGIDRRKYYHLFPESCRWFDAKLFYENPTHPNVAKFQSLMFFCKTECYLNALAHLLNTGQGVVLERSCQSDFVFVEAMYQKGFLSDDFYDYYKELRKAVLPHIRLQPHLVVYLDRPLKDCLEHIKRRNISWENNGKVIDMTYLGTIESAYRNYLKEADYESEILIYDWTVPGSVDSIVEDIEHLDLDTYEWHKHSKFENWANVADEDAWCDLRYKYTYKRSILKYFCLFPVEVPELLMLPDDYRQRDWVIENVMHGRYATGYNVDRGESFWKILFSFNAVQPLNAKWYEYYFRDGWYESIGGSMYSHEVEDHTIPEEDLKPRDFVMVDNKVLSKVCC